MRDQDEILQSVIDAAVRLLGAAGAMIDLLGSAGMAEVWTTNGIGARAGANAELLSEAELSPDAERYEAGTVLFLAQLRIAQRPG